MKKAKRIRQLGQADRSALIQMANDLAWRSENRKGKPKRGETHGHEYLWLTVNSANSYAEILREIVNRPLETIEELIASGDLRAGGN